MRHALAATLFLLSACDAALIGEQQAPVIDGIPTEPGMFAPVGSMVVNGSSFCTGTLLSPTVVLTAAHCVDPMFVGDAIPGFTLQLDATVVDPIDTFPGAAKYSHPDWDYFTDPGLGLTRWYDIAVVLLAQPVVGAELYALADPVGASDMLVPGSIATIVGYGRTQLGSDAYGVKHHANVELVEVGEFEILLSHPGGQQACHGDSGGPSLLSAGGQLWPVGVASRLTADSFDCDGGVIYTRIDPYLPWIYSVAPQLLEPPDAGPPDASPDAHLAAAADSGIGGDPDNGGCGCSTGRPGASAATAALLLLSLLWTRFRRRSVTPRAEAAAPSPPLPR